MSGRGDVCRWRGRRLGRRKTSITDEKGGRKEQSHRYYSMAVDYAPSLDQHDQKRKVGVITSAEPGRNLDIRVDDNYAKDFPEIVGGGRLRLVEHEKWAFGFGLMS